MTSHITSNVKLFFLGKRKYVQAPIQLEYALKEIQRSTGVLSLSDIFVNRFKQVHETNSPLKLIESSEAEPENSLRSTLAITIGERNLDYKLISIPGEIERHPDASFKQVSYEEHNDMEASVDLPSQVDYWELLNEAVQLTKIFHVSKYNNELTYRFIVGGFEQLRYFEPAGGEEIRIDCKIVRHLLHEGTIYNQNRIVVRCGSFDNTFLLPFIGKPL